MQWITNHFTIMGALEKNKCVVLVEKKLFEDDAASDDDDPMFQLVYPDLSKLLVQHISHAIFDDLNDKYECDAENGTHLL